MCSKLNFQESQVTILEHNIKKFLKTFENVYGKHYVTINFHELIHIPNNIRNNGSIFCLSCFGFENFNKLLKKSMHGVKGDLEIYRRFNMLVSSTRNLNLNSNSETTRLSKKLLSSVIQAKPRRVLDNGIGIYSKIKETTDVIENITYSNLYEVFKIKIGNEFITSASYDIKYKYRNSYLINLAGLKIFKVIRIILAKTDSGETIIYKGIECLVEKIDDIYFEKIGIPETKYKTKINGYTVAFLVRKKNSLNYAKFV